MKFSSAIAAFALARFAAAATQDIMELLAGTKDLSTLASMIKQIPELQKNVGMAMDITIFAPTNAAFDKMMKTDMMKDMNQDAKMALLEYHILQGIFTSSNITDTPSFLNTMIGDYKPYNNKGKEGVAVLKAQKMDDDVVVTGGLNMTAKVTKADIMFDGGVVHLIDTVLTPPMTVSKTAMQLKLMGIAGALTQTKLVQTVDMMPNVTIFAPDNAAFAKAKEMLTMMSPEDVATVLKYHIVPGTVAYSTMIKGEMSLKTVNGKRLTVRSANDMVYVNDKMVTKPDIIVNTGVVHVIDGILSPNMTDAKPNKTIVDTAAKTASEEKEAAATSGVSSTTMSGFVVLGVACFVSLAMVV